MAKAQFDWEAIRREYETNQFSDSELSRRHGCSRTAIQKRAKREKWSRDTAAQVRRVASAKLVAEDAKVAGKVAGRNAESERDEIELAAETRVALLRSHRKDIKNLRDIEQSLLQDLGGKPTKLYLAQYQGNVVEKEVEITVTEKCVAVNNLANTIHKRVALERQAFNLDDDSSEDKATESLSDIVSQLDGTTKGLPGE